MYTFNDAVSLMFMRCDDGELDAVSLTQVDQAGRRFSLKFSSCIDSDLRGLHSDVGEVLLKGLGRIGLVHHGVHCLETTLAVDDGQRVHISVDIRHVHVHQVGVDDLVGILCRLESSLMRLLPGLGNITRVTRNFARKDPVL